MIDRCREYETCPMSKPFNVSRSKGEFRYAKFGYIPSDCPCPGYNPLPVQNVIEKKTVYTENVTDGQFLKLQAEVYNLRENIVSHIAQSSKSYEYGELAKDENLDG